MMVDVVTRFVVWAQIQVPQPQPIEPPGSETIMTPVGWIMWAVVVGLVVAWITQAVMLAFGSGGYVESRARAKSRMVGTGVAAVLVGATVFILQTLVDLGVATGGGGVGAVGG